MNNLFKIIFLFITGLTMVSCSKDSESNVPLRDYEDQKAKDMTNIETFMKTHYMTVTNAPGQTEDQDVTFTKIPTGGTQISIWDDPAYPVKTREITVTQNEEEIDYKIYYIELRQGSGPNSKSPCNVDRVYTAYKGEYIYDSVETVGTNEIHSIISKEFETATYPSYFTLSGVIRGWSEIFPQFRTGSYTSNGDGTVNYNDFGAGVMFIPSGLAYFGGSQGSIPVYSPLIFNFKLYEIARVDNDGDGIDSYLEDLNGDGYVYALPEGKPNVDNTNPPGSKIKIGTNPDRFTREDEVPDFLDGDDDGDYFTTISEIKNPLTGEAFPFVDIPTCGGTGTKKKHLDPTCH